MRPVGEWDQHMKGIGPSVEQINAQLLHPDGGDAPYVNMRLARKAECGHWTWRWLDICLACSNARRDRIYK